MASTTWTATREQLVQELTKARTERDIVTTRLQTALAKEAEHRAKEREWKRRQKARKTLLAKAAEIAAEATIQPDPLAAQHRADLLAALKEKP